METEIYGIIPKPKIAACPKAPPVNKLNKPKNVSFKDSIVCLNASGFIPGIGT